MKLHRLLLSAFALCFFALSADAQYNPWWQWARADTFASLSVSGSPTVLGVKDGRALFGRITANATNVSGTIMGNWTFTEYDTNGVVTNTFRIRGKVEMIDAQGDAAGNWYVLGRFYDTLALPTVTYDRPNPNINPEPEYFMVKIQKNTFVMDWVTSHPSTDQTGQGMYETLTTRGGKYPDDPLYAFWKGPAPAA